jgi:hypothetical protein
MRLLVSTEFEPQQLVFRELRVERGDRRDDVRPAFLAMLCSEIRGGELVRSEERFLESTPQVRDDPSEPHYEYCLLLIRRAAASCLAAESIRACEPMQHPSSVRLDKARTASKKALRRSDVTGCFFAMMVTRQLGSASEPSPSVVNVLVFVGSRITTVSAR